MSVNITQQGLASASGQVNPNLFKTTPKSSTPTSYNAYQINMTENLTAGTTYTVQLWDVDVAHSEKAVANLGVWLYWGGGSVNLLSWAGTNYFTNGHADHLIATFTPTSSQASGSGATNAWINVYNSVGYVAGTMSMSISHWKLEKGSVGTPWIPASTDDIYIGGGCGFTEIDATKCSIGENCITATEFIEW